MVKSRRVFTREFKLAAVKELESGKPIGYVARQLEVNANTLDRWRREFRAQPTKAFSGQGRRVLAENRDAELERKIGQMTMENDFRLGSEFAAPTIQGIGIDFQLPRHIAYRLAGFQFFDRCQFELSCEHPSRLNHRPSSFSLIWVLTGCLIFGVHSKRSPCFLRTKR